MSRSRDPQRGRDLCFPIPLQSTRRLRANDQDWAAPGEAKNRHGANSKELADLLLGRPVAGKATERGKVSDLRPESRGHGWGGLEVDGGPRLPPRDDPPSD